MYTSDVKEKKQYYNLSWNPTVRVYLSCGYHMNYCLWPLKCLQLIMFDSTLVKSVQDYCNVYIHTYTTYTCLCIMQVFVYVWNVFV